MTRYRLVTTAHTSGGFTEFTAEDDAAAAEYAQQYLYGARVLSLTDVSTSPYVERLVQRDPNVPVCAGRIAVAHEPSVMDPVWVCPVCGEVD